MQKNLFFKYIEHLFPRQKNVEICDHNIDPCVTWQSKSDGGFFAPAPRLRPLTDSDGSEDIFSARTGTKSDF
jgi:hypothetical protein